MGSSLCFFIFMHLVTSFSLFNIAFAHFNSSMQPLCHDDERSVLLKFKERLTINQTASGNPSAYPKVASWKLDSDCCSWDGVKCNKDTGHVVELDLASSCLYGSINSGSSLFHLVHLERLNLYDNHFNFSEIPHEILNFSRLTHLNLSDSFFSGQVPAELLQLSSLELLDLSYNENLRLQNPGLANLSVKLTNLKHLDLTYVDISTAVPLSLANLTSLIFLSLGGCFLQGKIPDSIENLESLTYLDISDNSLTGKIPPSLGNLTKLEKLFLYGNGFSNELPTSIGNIASLQTLEISSINISGKVAASLGNLTQLSALSIVDSNFSDLKSSSLSWLANLNQLTFLDFSNCNLTGEIPSVLFNLTQLAELDLSKNQLTGPIPVEIGNLTQLQGLNFGSNQLEGSVPNSIFELKNLYRLDLSFNNLSGTVDLNMFLLNLKSLTVLVLSSNKLSLLTRTTVHTYLQKFRVIGFRSCNLSEFSYFLHNQDQLMSLDLSSNKITGQIPGWFLNASPNSLEYLNLSHNLLTGFEQDFFVRPWSIYTLDLRFNKLLGPLPVPQVDIYSYLVSNNQLRGEIPPWICSLNGLHALDLSYNNLSGMLPECLGNFSVELSVLKLQGNNFHGFIPQIFRNGTNLRMIDFSNNSLQGRVPKSLANCLKLKFLNLGDNQLTDIFPSWLGNLSELEVLVLKSNNFHGVIEEHKACFGFLKLRIIDLSHNRFTGNLPSKYFQCWNAMKDINASELTYMHDILTPQGYPVSTYFGFSDYSLTLSNKGTELEYEKLSNLITAIIFSNNSFVGEISPSIANLKGLRNLNLSHNNLEGHIPSSLGDLKALESLDLSSNMLSGQIPQQLGEITALAVFDVSHNQLTGPIPQGKQFYTFGNGSFEGNPGLCGEPLSKQCDNSKVPQEENQPSQSPFEFGWKTVLTGYVSGAMIGVILGHIFSTRNHEWLAKIFRLKVK